MKQHLEPTPVLLLLISVTLGMLYPLAVTGISQALFPHHATGSILMSGGKAVGSELIGQQFSRSGYFWARLSAPAPVPYTSAASTGSNPGPLNDALMTAVPERVSRLRAGDQDSTMPIPVDLVTASRSGPEIGYSGECDPLRQHLQCADHYRAYPARFAWGEIHPMKAPLLLRRQLLIYGVGGLLAPFIGIKLVDLVLVVSGCA